MLALVVDPQQPGTIRVVREYPDPEPRGDEVLVRMLRAGICSTDLEIVKGYMGFRGVPGHEFVGRVIEGPRELRGRRVVAEINCAPIGSPPLPDAERKHLKSRTVIGILARDGAFAERLVVPQQNCHVLPDAITDDAGVFVEPLAAACQILEDHAIVRTHRVAILGSGRLGLLCAQALGTTGCELQVLGRNPVTLGLCAQLGIPAARTADVEPRADRDFVVECTGSAEGLRLAMRYVRPRGTIVLKSTYANPQALDLSPCVIDEIRVCGSRCGPFSRAIRMLEAGWISTHALVSRVYPLSMGVEAFAAAADPRHVKVLLSSDGE